MGAKHSAPSPVSHHNNGYARKKTADLWTPVPLPLDTLYGLIIHKSKVTAKVCHSVDPRYRSTSVCSPHHNHLRENMLGASAPHWRRGQENVVNCKLYVSIPSYRNTNRDVCTVAWLERTAPPPIPPTAAAVAAAASSRIATAFDDKTVYE